MTHTKDIYYKIHQHASPYFIHVKNSRMVPYTDKYDKVGKKRLRQIHTRVNYLAEECGFMDKDIPPSFKVHGLCICCVQNCNPMTNLRWIQVPKHNACRIRCSGLAWLLKPETNSSLREE